MARPDSYKIQTFKCRLVRDRTFKSGVQKVECSAHAAGVFMQTLADLPHEEMHVLHLNATYEIIGFQVVSVGGTAGTSLTAADIFRGAIIANARAIIMAHNHPSGSVEPSADDIDTTRAIKIAGGILGIPLVDHLVCAPSACKWASLIGFV